MAAIGRRTLIVAASLAGLGAAVGVIAFRSANRDDPSDPQNPVFLDAVADDYRNGRVVVAGGWVVSVSELSAYRSRQTSTQ